MEKIKINKKNEFNLGVALNFLGFVAIMFGAVLSLFPAIAFVRDTTIESDLLTRLVEDFT
jgi:hypothetical protein